MRHSESLMKALLCNLLSKTLKYKGMVCTYFIQACAVLKSPPYCFTCFQKELEEEEEEDDDEEESERVRIVKLTVTFVHNLKRIACNGSTKRKLTCVVLISWAAADKK